MPIYDYKCSKCGFQIEIHQSINSKVEQCCLTCSEPMQKQVSTPASLHFKGSGFYQTDYKDRSSDVL